MPVTQPQPLGGDAPPPPLDLASAHLGLTIPQIAAQSKRTSPGLHYARKRFKVEPLKFRNTWLFSQAQADYIVSRMNKRKANPADAQCHPC